MNRRDFSKIVMASFVSPSLFLDYKPKQMNWDLRFHKLPFYPNPDLFVQNQEYEIIKGPHSVKTYVNAGQDLLDCHGLCATFEWASIIRQELEYGSEGIRKLYSLGWDCPDREYWVKKLKRVEISKVEYAKLILFCHKLRGEHPCCLPHKRTIWGFADRAIRKLEPEWNLEISMA